MPEDKLIRVLDQDVNVERTVLESQKHLGNYKVLKADAVDVNGDPLPPKSLSNKSTDGQRAESPKEK